MHTCPAPGCAAKVPSDMLACRRDWYRLPVSLRNRVWDAWRGPGPGTPEHADAVAAALDWYKEHP